MNNLQAMCLPSRDLFWVLDMDFFGIFGLDSIRVLSYECLLSIDSLGVFVS